jgi:ribosomal protein L32
MFQQKSRCANGQHRPKMPAFHVDRSQGDPDLPHSNCTRCGRLLVKSPFARGWRLTGMMG